MIQYKFYIKDGSDVRGIKDKTFTKEAEQELSQISWKLSKPISSNKETKNIIQRNAYAQGDQAQ